MKLRLVSTCVLVFGIAALASASAFAGNGNGQGNGKGNGKDDLAAAPAAVADTSQGHGNSAIAPGQLKKDEAPAPTAAALAQADATQEVSSAQSGVKPSNDTAHDTHAAASSDETKLYGSGKTAGTWRDFCQRIDSAVMPGRELLSSFASSTANNPDTPPIPATVSCCQPSAAHCGP